MVARKVIDRRWCVAPGFAMGKFSICRSDPSIVPVARYRACEIVWHRREQPVVAVCEVVRVVAVVPIFPAGTCGRYRGNATLQYEHGENIAQQSFSFHCKNDPTITASSVAPKRSCYVLRDLHRRVPWDLY